MSGNKDALPSQLRAIRLERFGEEGIPAIAEVMKIPAGTWENLEGGVQVSGWAVLQVIEIFGVDPHWLLTGEGERYRARAESSRKRSER